MKVHFARKPRKCPNCGSQKIATYLYGLLHHSAELKKALDEGSIVLGGCEIGGTMPEWVCADCTTDFFRSDPGPRPPKPDPLAT